MGYRPKETIKVSKTVTCNGGAGTTVNLFQVSGLVDVHDVFGQITEVTENTVLSTVALILYDGTNTVEITEKTIGADLSGVAVNALLRRSGLAIAELDVKLATSCSVMEEEYESNGGCLKLWGKPGADTYIKLQYTGNNGVTDVDLRFNLIYTPIFDGSSIVAV